MLATTLTGIAALFLLAAMPVLGARKPGYSHLRHTISEIGEAGARDQRLVAFGLFLPVGLLLLGVAALAQPASRDVATLALCIAVGYVGAALFPCDPGAPMSGSLRTSLHNLAGAVEYVGGGVSLLAIARDAGPVFQAAGVIVLGTGLGLSLLPAGAGRGALQRIGEAALFAGLGLATWRLLDTV